MACNGWIHKERRDTDILRRFEELHRPGRLHSKDFIYAEVGAEFWLGPDTIRRIVNTRQSETNVTNLPLNNE